MHALQAAGASTVVLNVRVRLCVRPAAAHLPLPLLTRDGNNGIPGAEITPRQVEPPHNARGQQRLQWRIRGRRNEDWITTTVILFAAARLRSDKSGDFIQFFWDTVEIIHRQ